jgi:tetratricopeptide (TPR) repeat protein
MDVPQELAARVLFAADRTCCVCRTRGKPVQIHHIDDDSSNNDLGNLAVLCFDCHRETQLRGGFDRKLNSDQVILYRDDWNRLVERGRSRETAAREAARARDNHDLELATSLAEIYHEANAYDELAIHYNILGNTELRDKYIALAIENNPSDDTVIFLRGLQGREDLIPAAVIKRYLSALTRERNWHNRARALKTVGRNVEAVSDYIRSIHESLGEKDYFPAAFYLKELSGSGLLKDLFVRKGSSLLLTHKNKYNKEILCQDH